MRALLALAGLGLAGYALAGAYVALRVRTINLREDPATHFGLYEFLAVASCWPITRGALDESD